MWYDGEWIRNIDNWRSTGSFSSGSGTVRTLNSKHVPYELGLEENIRMFARSDSDVARRKMYHSERSCCRSCDDNFMAPRIIEKSFFEVECTGSREHVTDISKRKVDKEITRRCTDTSHQMHS